MGNKVKKNTVLIVDDENSNIMALTHILSSGYTIYAAKNGQNAIRAAEKYLPDVILLDIIMPEMDGYAVLAALKASKKTQNIPVIFITGLSDITAEEKGLALGVADYITKPFSAAIVKLRLLNQIKLIEQFRLNEYDIMKYKLSNDALNIALWDMDAVSNNFTWSQELRQMLGFDDERDFPNELCSWSNRLHPEDKKRVLDAFAAHINDCTGQIPYNIEYRLMLKNGEYRHFQALGTTFRDHAGAPIRVAGAMMDITEKKRAEREIAQAMAKIETDAHWYKSILDAIPLPIAVTDANMNWTFVNKAFEIFLGKKREDMHGKHCSNWNSYICNTDDCGIACAKRGVKHTFFTNKDLSYKIDVEILLDMKGKIAGFIEVVQDITDIQLLAKQRAESEITSRSKSIFLANMSHEIRTPMNVILGITEIMIQSQTLPLEIEDGLYKIYNSCDLLLGIINDILDFSKIEAGKLDIISAQYKVANLINDSVQLNAMQFDSKPIKFELQIDENIPAELLGDDLRIKQILNNLLSNAFKYTDAGTVTLSVAFECEPEKEGITLVLSVRDTGRGMTKEQMEKLFDEYSRLNQESNRNIEGTGLGLAITQRLLNLMNGNIRVDSELGIGSQFVARLPQGTMNANALGKKMADDLRNFRMYDTKRKKRVLTARDHMPYGKILIVDDMETNLYVAAGLMKLYELQIDTAMSGHAAIDKIKNGKEYDIVFMDHMMPEMDGIETTKLLRNMGYTAPIVAFTANAVVGQADIFLQSGFDDFISKPIDVRHLNSILNKLVRDKQPPEVIEAARQQMSRSEASGYSEQPQMDLLLLESFNRDTRKAVAMLEELLQKNKFENEELRGFIIAIHGIKSSLRNIGESELSNLASKLEQAGREQNISLITDSIPEFMKKLRALLEKFETKLEAGKVNGTDENIEDLRNKLLIANDLCVDYDRKGVLEILANIKNCSKETRTVLDTVRALVLHSEFDEAKNAIALYVANMQMNKETI